MWVRLRDQLAEVEKMRRVWATRRGIPTGSCATARAARTEFPYISPSTTQAPSLEGA